MNKKITIVTGTGGHLGTGHLQRMLSLTDYLKKNTAYKISIQSNLESKNFIPECFHDNLIDDISNTDLIIRDMRDSSLEEIIKLKQFSPVISIDDIGPGRDAASFTYDLLPNLVYSKDFLNEDFIYGYNFIQTVETLNKKIVKDNDIAVYLGSHPDKKLKDLILHSIPNSFKYIFIDSYEKHTSNLVQSDKNISFAEIVSRSKIFITYFGISLFEAHLCGCKIITINPSEYHLALSKLISNTMKILMEETYSSVTQEDLSNVINSIRLETMTLNVDTEKITNRIEMNLSNFTKKLFNLNYI